MTNRILTLKFGINRCYILNDKISILIDGGPVKAEKAFKKYLSVLSIPPNKIKLIVLTHGDFDHVGSAEGIKAFTGAKTIIHLEDKRNMEESIFNWPPGTTRWGRTFRFVIAPFLKKIKWPSVKADIVINQKEFSLKDYGIDGRIIHTPGHTPGSLSVLLDNGDAFVGCLAHNNFPFKFNPGLPIFAEDQEKVKESWKLLIDQGAKMIYPAHGDPFSVEKIKKYL